MTLSIDRKFPEIAGGPLDADDLKPYRKNEPKNARKVWFAVGGGVLIVFFVLLFIPVVRVTPENVARIKHGMTREQVEAILGGPPEWYDGVGGIEFFGPPYPPDKGRPGFEWTAIDGCVYVVFDGKGRVFEATFYPIHVLNQDLWSFVVERLTRCTRSRWESWWRNEVWPGKA